jgi:2-oxo-3-hexenedioate decarboxylase
MQQMGISELIWGRLTDAMRVEDGGEVDLTRFVHPRVEPEVAFLLGSEVSPGASLPETIAAVEAVASALEIIDSRYSDFRFSLTDVIADNASSSAFVVGPWHRPDVDLANRGIVLSVSGRTVGVGTTAAILGHPVRSLAAGLRLAAAAGETLPAGSIVMAGGATSAHPLARGCVVRVEISRLGSASFTVAP